jgi:hypothetical protein
MEQNMRLAAMRAGIMNRKNTCRRHMRGITMGLLLGMLPLAFCPAVQQARAEGGLMQTSARYLINVHGLHVLTANVGYRLGINAYSGIAQVRTAGFFGLFVQTDMRMQGSGQFLASGQPEPAQYDSAGTYNHEQSHLHMTYQAGVPQITVQEPPIGTREKVTPEERAGAQDIVALLVGLVHQMQTHNRCDEAPQKLFDGLRLSVLSLRNTGVERPPSSASHAWGSESVTCNFVLQQVKGFTANGQFSKLRQPQIGRVWFENIPNIGMSVVRLEVEHPKMGHVVMRLDETPKQTP